jgi:hypothetical protein
VIAHPLVAQISNEQRFRDEVGNVIHDNRGWQIAGYGNGGVD